MVAELPIHFFTIVLNGQPFIRYHIDMFRRLPFRWHWHVIEGVAALKHDTAWSVRNGGSIPESFHDRGRSNDGTSAYLDELQAEHPDRITLYRQPEGQFWNGKRAMVNAPLANIKEECLLWQVDADELWTADQITAGRQLFLQHPEKTAAWYWCWYFVGKDLVVRSRHCYSQNPELEWLRTWRYRAGMTWRSHEPPRLVDPQADGQADVAAINPFTHAETEAHGLVFQHFAYATREQLLFKEGYYGYTDACSAWCRLQRETVFPCPLGRHLPWVMDETEVDRAAAVGVTPLARPTADGASWSFGSAPVVESTERPFPKVVVDGVFFQLGTTGIARVWHSLLEEWSRTGFVRHLVLLDRGHTAPHVAGLRTRSLPRYDPHRAGHDASLLQNVCDEENADLFISTYYTAPLTTPSVHLAYDFIPEMRGADLNASLWREKRLAILHASAHLAISDSTARDLVHCFPHISRNTVTVAYPGVSPHFFPASAEDVADFRKNYGITKPYFLIVGERVGSDGYKNTALFFEAFARLPGSEQFAVVCTGGKPKLEQSLAQLTRGRTVHQVRLADAELRAAYSGAVALVYPSLYEGFGLPVAEALASGCPVITCRTSSIPEVAGDAAIYVGENDVAGMMAALETVQRPEVRQRLAEAGPRQAAAFTWPAMAKTIADTLLQTATRLRAGLVAPPAPVWAEFRDLQSAHSRSTAYFLDRAGRVLRRIQRGQYARLRSLWERSKAALSFRKAG